ncbi:hypothetical protein [Sandarakinorhabdus sp. DWP1-3-1]|uniref:hypothetical protein n=1 Tax=Sandarakinorhabdus sp. DWP1-3-1 TaxID=2804627 RepID=UPI003CEFD866
MTEPALAFPDAAEIAISALDKLSRLRALTDQESADLARLLGVPEDETEEVDRRPIPPDFEAMYIELGPKVLPEHYSASNRTVRRWSEEAGRSRLRAERAAVLAAIWEVKRERACKTAKKRANIAMAERRRRALSASEPAPDPDILRAAAHYLRIPQNGGHRVSPSGEGDWFIGAVRVTAQDLIRRATVRGFDPGDVRPALRQAPETR